MAYSGTYGQTVVTVQDLIDHGARNCGKLAEELGTYDQVPLQGFVDKFPLFDGQPSETLLRVLYHYRALGIARV